MKISIVTVCRNAETTIAATIKSVRGQTHGDFEHLILDGASTDGTVAAARQAAGDDRRIVIESAPDAGLYDALNKGLLRFSGEAVGALNADDVFHDDTCLARVATGLVTADIVYGDLDMVRPDGRVLRRWRARARPPRALRNGWMPPHPTFYIRRSVAGCVGPFDLSYQIAADYDFMVRALSLPGVRMAHIPAVLVDMATGGKSTASVSAMLRHNFEAARIRHRRLGTPRLDAALLLKPLRKVHQLVA